MNQPLLAQALPSPVIPEPGDRISERLRRRRLPFVGRKSIPGCTGQVFVCRKRDRPPDCVEVASEEPCFSDDGVGIAGTFVEMEPAKPGGEARRHIGDDFPATIF
jgi:hypothetical protein